MNEQRITALISALSVLNHEADMIDRLLVRDELLKELQVKK